MAVRRRTELAPRAALPGKRRLSTLTLFSVSTLSTVLGLACVPQRGTVGARFGRDADGHLFVRDAPSGLGAARAGIREGDEVILIEGRDVRPLSEADLHAILSGERGTRVRLTLLRGEAVLRLAVERLPPPSPVDKQ